MLIKLFKQVHSYIREARKRSTRSSRWEKVEKDFLALNSKCACCGNNKKLQVHHIKPFAAFPELELDPTNLVTLCMENLCHLKIGHGDNFKNYNPHILDDLRDVQVHPDWMQIIFNRAKAQRRPM